MDIFSLSETKREIEMFCKTETKYKRESEQSTLNVIVMETKLISQWKCLHKMFCKSGVHMPLVPHGVGTTDYMSIKAWYSGCLSQPIRSDWFDDSRTKLHLRLEK